MSPKIAPGAYQTENAPSKQQTPSYSFGVKVNHTKVSDTPCKFFGFFFKEIYTLPKMLHKRTYICKIFAAPCAYKPEKITHTPRYSFGIKHKETKLNETPGWFT